MWGAVFRQIFAYLLTRRGKRALAFTGMLLLCFVTALLLDTKLFISATFTGLLSAIFLLMWLIQYWRVRQHDRTREIKRADKAARREETAQVRIEKIGRAKSAVADAARSIGEGAANTFSAARSKLTSSSEGMRFWRRRRGNDEP